MKQLFFCVILLVTVLSSALSATIARNINHAEIIIPDYLLVKNFVRMNIHEFEKASGHHLGFFQKRYFKKLQKKLSTSEATQNSTILPYYDVQKGKFKLDLQWFILGCIIGPFALLFATTSRQPKNKKLSALIGFGVFVLWFGWLFIF